MSTRDKEVLNMQLVLVPVLAEAWKKSFSELSDLFRKEVCEKVIAELKPENLPKQYFFRTDESVKTLSFDKVKRQVIG